MSFNIPDLPEEAKTFRKTVYYKFSKSDPKLIQFIDDDFTWFFVHTISVPDAKWLKIPHTEDCPICAVPEWREKHRITRRFRINVLDVTPEKVCPECGATYNILKGSPSICSCGANIESVRPEPRKEVKLLENGPQLAGLLNEAVSQESALDPTFDAHRAVYLLSGVGLEKSVSIRKEIPFTEGEYEPFDLSMLEFSKPEVHRLMAGDRLRDVLKDRNQDTEKPKETGGLDFSGTSLPGLE